MVGHEACVPSWGDPGRSIDCSGELRRQGNETSTTLNSFFLSFYFCGRGHS